MGGSAPQEFSEMTFFLIMKKSTPSERGYITLP